MGTQWMYGQESLESLTFRDALGTCVQAVGAGDLESASDLFASLEAIFGEEEEYRSAAVQRRLLPLKGLSELGAGRYGKAAQTLEILRKRFPDTLLNNPSLLYGLAQAHRGAGQLAQARESLDLYVERFPNTVEAGLAFLEKADLLFLEGRMEEGLSSLADFNESNAPESLKMQGQLKAAQACLDTQDADKATAIMLNTRWSVTAMPELAQLAFSALRCGEYSLARADYGNALRLFQLVPPKAQLIRLQKSKLEELARRLQNGSRRVSRNSSQHQQSYLASLEQRLAQQLRALEESEDYTPSYYLHYGQCLLFDSQFYKAWLVFEYLSLNDGYPQAVREEAHYRWVVCAHQLADWEEALTIARNFVDRYPESKLAPQALYLIAKAHLEQRRYPESVEVLSDLIDRFPEHPLQGRWIFTRGFNQVVLQAYAEARSDFARYERLFARGPLLQNARLWNAITYFFEKNYPGCIDRLKAMRTLDSRHPLYPEILYRLASAHYAARDHDEAREVIEDFLTQFTRHSRTDEARVLKGDIAMGQGELETATASFGEVSKQSPDLYLYSKFQVGKILRAIDDYGGMVSHFQRFLDDPDSPRARLSEALYWLGWAHQQLGQIEEAFPVFEEALDVHGNDPSAAETTSMLQSLERLKKRQGETPIQHNSALVQAESFGIWLEGEINRAEKTGRNTYLSRLVLFYHQRYPEKAPERFPFPGLADWLPLESIDPDALGHLGLTLLAGEDPRAKRFLSYLVETYPRAHARAMGYLGLAKLAYREENYTVAKQWLTTSADRVPVHPLMNEAQLLFGQTLFQLKEYGASVETFEKLLRLKSARGRPHATALMGIAKAHQSQGDPEKATAYYQRVYNMYRAYPDLVAEAYWESAGLFEHMQRIPDAINTLREMLGQKQLAEFSHWPQAKDTLTRLLPLLPEGFEETNPGMGGTENE